MNRLQKAKCAWIVVAAACGMILLVICGIILVPLGVITSLVGYNEPLIWISRASKWLDNKVSDL